jgi:hypothetical protein
MAGTNERSAVVLVHVRGLTAQAGMMLSGR